MRTTRRFDLTEFLSEPRFLNEIVEHYGVSKKTAAFHLQEAIRSGQVSVSEPSAFRTIKDSRGNLRKLKGLKYVRQKETSPAGQKTGFTFDKNDESVQTTDEISRNSWHTNPHEPPRASTEKREIRNLVLFKKRRTPSPVMKPEAHCTPAPKPDSSSTRISSNQSRTSPAQPSKRYLGFQSSPLLQAEKIRLFQTMLNDSVPFLDLRAQFDVSRPTIARLVKNGLLVEVWGSTGVGVRFKLTTKGKTQLKELEKVSTYKPMIRNGPLTRLKQRTTV